MFFCLFALKKLKVQSQESEENKKWKNLKKRAVTEEFTSS